MGCSARTVIQRQIAARKADIRTGYRIGRNKMKNGKNPTVSQKKALKAAGLNPENWLISKDTPESMLIIHRVSGKARTVRKE